MSLNNSPTSIRYRYGETDPIQMPFDQTLGNSTTTPVGYPIDLSDLCFFDPQDVSALGVPGCVKAADQFAWTSNLATTQTNFAIQFAGVSAQRWQALLPLNNVQANYGIKDGLMTINRQGTYEFACAAGSTFTIGDLLGPDKNPSSNNLLPQQLVKVATVALAIAVCVRSGTNLSTVWAQLGAKGPIGGIGGAVQPTTTTSTTTTTTSTTTTSTTTTTTTP